MRWNGLYWIITRGRKQKRRPRPPKPRHWFKAGEVAKAVGVTPRTVRRWVAEGKLLAERLPSGRCRFASAEVMRLMRIPKA